jgi:outer membrane receptor protein involved in Fe transport
MGKNHFLQQAIRLALANAAVASVALPVASANADSAKDASAGPPAPLLLAQANEPAQGAAASNAPTTANTLQEVVVTGSRISIPGLHSTSPVISVSSKAITQLGATSVEDVLNQLPQVLADQGASASNGASGTATVNLRGLGSQRTLVLIDGQRLMPGDPATGDNTADINNIPTALVERVDVLTGGASSVYGADAVAGVVNFIMNDHFQGFEINANASAYQHSQHEGYFGQFSPAAGYGSAPSSVMDGAEKDISFILGSDFADGKGNATAYLTYRRTNPVVQDSRDFSRCTLATSGGTVKCSGSSTAATGGFFFTNPPGANGYFTGPPISGTVDPATGQIVPGIHKYNYGATNYYIRPDERWNGGYFAHYNLDQNHQVYSSFMMMTDHTVAQIAPSGAFLTAGLGVNPVTGLPDGGWTVNCDNPLLSAQEQSTLCGTFTSGNASVLFGRRNVEGGNRQDHLNHTSFRMVIGSKGNLTDNLTYNVYAQEGLTLLQENYQNDVSKQRITYALNAVVDPQTGQVVCAANANGANGAPGCVPWDIWGLGSPYASQYTNAAGGPSAASVAYITTPGSEQGRTEERVYHADFTYDGTSAGIKLPTAHDGLVTNFGAEYREEFVTLRPDQEFLTGDLAGQGGAITPISAGFGVKEGFVEMRLPVVQNMRFAKEISINPGYRYSKYDYGPTTSTYKIEADWAPTSDFRFRGGYNRAVRAPNLGELFAERHVALDGSEDPCATTGFGAPPSYLTGAALAARKASCLAHGVTVAQFGASGVAGNPAGQYNGLIGGNPQLSPEKADTYTFGVVFTPTFVPTLSATIDYYDIKINNVIGSYGANLIVNQCIINNNPLFCNLVHRDGSGSIWLSQGGYVNDPTLNLGYIQERGADLAVHYREDLGRFGALNYALNGTYEFSFITEPYPGSGTYNCAGYFGGTCGNPQPKWRHTFTATWETPVRSLDFTVRWRHFGNTEIDSASPSPLLASSFQKDIQWTGSRDYLDLVASYELVKGVHMLVGVNNVLDKDPPILPSTSLPAPFFNGNTYPQVYDTLGRYIFMNLKADF